MEYFCLKHNIFSGLLLLTTFCILTHSFPKPKPRPRPKVIVDEYDIDEIIDYPSIPAVDYPPSDPHRRAVEREFPGANIQKIKNMEAIKKMLPVKNMQEIINIDEVKHIEEIDDEVADKFIDDESLVNVITGNDGYGEDDIIGTVDGDEGGYAEEEFHDDFLDAEGIPLKGELDDPEAVDLVDGIENEEEIVSLLEGKKETEEAKLNVLEEVQERHVVKRDHLIAKYRGLADQIEERLNEGVEDIQASYNKLTFFSHLSEMQCVSMCQLKLIFIGD